MDQLEFRLLGPFEVRSGQQMILSGGGKRRAVLAVLLLSANEAVSIERLIDALWGETAPASAVNLVQGYVSDLRRILEPDRPPRASGQRLVSSHGYRLVVSEDECDLMRFGALLGKAGAARETGDLPAASWLLSRALGEWRGAPLLDFTAEQFATVAASRLQEVRVSAVEAAAEVELALGRPDRALGYLPDLPDADPFRERLAELRILALYRSGRQADALAVYETIRLRLADELGVDPGPALRKLHLEVLRQEPTLIVAAPPVMADALPPLPVALSSFVGRERELESVLQMLGSHRLVTLTGPGGSGKTRLAIEASTVVRAAGELEVAFVDLTPIRAVELVGATIADACRLRVRPDLAVASLAAQLAGRRVLLVLDNVEHLLDAVPDIAALLASAPGVAILATSREPLGLEGEQQFPVPPLALPARLPDAGLEEVLASDAVRLFVDRARAANPGFSVAVRDAAALAGVCRRLDGLPLALELAAPWTKALTLRALLERLDRSLELLVGATRHGPERHRSLRTAIEWSYAALPHPERELLQTLSLFASGAPLEGVEAVAPAPGAGCLPALAALVDKSLVVRTGIPQQPRYRLLETIREYAAERLAADAEAARATRMRHAQYYCLVAEKAGRAAHTAAGDATAFRLAEEAVEIRAALDFLNGTGSSEAALTLAIDCLPLWWDLGHIEEGYRHLTGRLNASGASRLPPLLRAAASAGAAILAEAAGYSDAAVALARSAGKLAAEAGAQTLEALALAVEGDVSMWGESQTQALERLHEAIDLASLAPDGPARWGWASRPVVVISATLSLAETYRFRDPKRARELLTPALEVVSDRHLASFLLRALGFLAVDSGNYLDAESLLQKSLVAARELGSGRSQSRSHEGLAALAWAKGDLVTAAAEAEHALRISRDAGHAYNWGRCAALRADVLIEQGDITRAGHVLGTAISAIEGHDRDFTRRVLAPRQARVARLSGRTSDAAAALARARPVQRPDQLAPERVVYLIEDALASLGNRDHARAGHLASDLIAQAARLGLVMPLPERNRINTLLFNSASGAHSSSK
jgi:predicted ATPase/DNA-binding SARP family transcriptional activator